ncbi:hypothetical protein M436DRAFT_84239 [Aureobasidium namibiae CBS 147.97]|uniref:Uncharacterized protein n=1 Tax=Aureobasidium namibiae CBS 147.97 TaxID=1043004 RepID=A0A074WLM3_9PEZI|nr:uncharacterized protein M436DRAFT_84239 [Aureobasidium namibiae CBS 147.97]KEQ70662.1 hypothetical protein M436DRAFT_84239 [Aureobasidium namibiae CBS 147.97]
MRSIAILAGFAALAADMPIAVHRVPEAHDDDVGTFHHYFDFVFRPSVDMPGPVKQEKSQASIPECSMAARGLGSTTEPYDCQNPDLGRNPEEADQQLNTTPFRSTIEKSNGSLPHKATRAIRSSTNCSLSAITTNHFFRLASAAPVELPDKDSITSQYFQTPTVLAICFVTLLFAVWVSTASRKRWNGCLYVATLGSSIMSIAVLNMGSDAEANQVWVILTSFCLYVAWLRRLSKMTTPRTPEALDIRTTPRPGSAESPEGAVDAENLENPERPDNQR